MQNFCLKNLDVSLDQGILDTHKGSFGHLLIAGGDTGYGGAGIIASEAAIMSGCGLVTLITKKEHIQSSLSRNPEVIALGVDGRQDAEGFLRDQKNFRDLHPDNTENFFLNLTREETSRGLNPTTISDLTGIPRQTVIRNLKNLTKSKALEKDTNRNLFYVPKNTSQQKSIVETLKKIQLVISQNVNKTLIAV